MAREANCPLCDPFNEVLLWQGAQCRVISAQDAMYPGFCRVIWHAHVREMTELGEQDQQHLMRVTFAVEQAIRTVMSPLKINLASFGNQVPHLHWHVIPRFAEDAHFPDPVWAPVRRQAAAPTPLNLSSLKAGLSAALGTSGTSK